MVFSFFLSHALSEVSQPDLPEGFLICYLNLIDMKNPSYQCVSIDSEYLRELILKNYMDWPLITFS